MSSLMSAGRLGLRVLAAGALMLALAGGAMAQTNSAPPGKGEFTSEGLRKKWGHLSSEEVQKAAEAGSVEAMLALCERVPDSVESPWLVKAAEAGEPWAQCRLGWCYERPFNNNESNKHRSILDSVKWYRRSAAQDFGGGLYHLALCYESGKGVIQDEEKALELMRKGADGGHWYSLYELAGYYDKGIGEPRNEHDHPVDLLIAAAAHGQRDASAALVDHFKNGKDIEKDLIMAAKHYVFAADRHRSSYPLANAENPRPDKQGHIDPFASALALYVKATRLNPEPITQLAEMYFTGRDCPRHLVRAWMYLGVAAEFGGTNTAMMAAIEKELTPEKLAEAKSLVSVKREELKTAANIIRRVRSLDDE